MNSQISSSGKLAGIGFRGFISTQRVLTITTPGFASVKQIIAEARERRELIDATHGRRIKSVIIMDSGHVILSATPPKKVA
ncbi:DUF370 domain-containing protein [filamentous cyanobacterium LEGE 11480]|uniref:DUF370 domain-containing protein n=1 Tax=Romeriopsis navalis LEGE 11480 TaxID=2777977 RepID=A0A928VQY4_9CYAN|nr:extracellular matrix/biofilm biosynthesis regulator RemA family protein [Romeriopsis navalis]MBE9030489.1 DUF370 domain-containing protein [Romeriopsis navalis LEGE 11480]